MSFNVPPRQTAYDAIVVGSGITGGWAAKELCERGLKTLVLERGPHVEHGRDYTGEHKADWELPFRGRGDRELYQDEYPIQSENYAFGPATKQFFVNDKRHPYQFDPDKEFRWIRGYHLGGRSLTWGRLCWRWSEIDFEANARDGFGVDWPIRYEEIAPWYDHVESFVGISGQAEGLSQIPDGRFLPPMPMNVVERALRDRIGAAFPERVMTIGRCAVLSQAHLGRAACHYCGPCHRGCSTGSYFSSLSATLPAAAATGNLEIRTDAIVHRIEFDPDHGGGRGRATGVEVVDAETRESTRYRARVIFLCASTIGSAYILLNSTSSRFPNGFANRSDALGHYLMDHTKNGGAGGRVPGFENSWTVGNRPTVAYVPRFRNLDDRTRRPEFLRGYGVQVGAGRSGWDRGIAEVGLGVELKQHLRKPGPWYVTLRGYGEMLPRYENHIELTDEKDTWGLPILKVHCSFSENEDRMRDDMRIAAAEMLEAAGCTDIQDFDLDDPPGFSVHEMGTARMGRDPKTSVLNKWNQCHEAPNVFVTDGACMPSSACQNPSITYMALTARACDHAVEEMKRGNI